MSYNLGEVDVKIKLKVNKTTSLEDINRYLYPIEDYVREKKDENMYDDWNEFEHMTSWLKNIFKNIQKDDTNTLDIHYLEDKGNVIGVVFSLSGNDNISNFFNQYNIQSSNEKAAQIAYFHIVKNYRGIGKKWLQEEVLKDLQNQGFKSVYLKSSHQKAFSLYEKLGSKVGHYTGLSDNKLYQRYGNIYKISL